MAPALRADDGSSKVAESGRSLEGGKKRGAGSQQAKSLKKRAKKEIEEKVAVDAGDSQNVSASCGTQRLRRAAATTKSYKESKVDLGKRDAQLIIKDEKVVDSEVAALAHTMCSEGVDAEGTPRRRLLEANIYNDEGKSVPLESWDEASTMWLSGIVIPHSSPASKDKGVRCEGIGPITDWNIDGFEKGSSQAALRISTESGDYVICKAVGSYRKIFEKTQEKADLCVEVFRALSKPDGGNPDLTHMQLVSSVSQAIRSRAKPGAKAYFAQEPLLQHGSFVAQKLAELDEAATDGDQLFSDLEAIKGLAASSAEHLHFKAQQAMALGRSGGTLTIRENASSANGSASSDDPPSTITSDGEYARMLAMQEEINASAKVGRRRQPTQGLPKTYIKINEDEIADDYPAPAYFQKAEDEGNELDLFEGDDGIDFEFREEKKLEDWTLYNGELRLISLEMLPMLAGVDEDITIFGSGIVSTDDGGGYCIGDAESPKKGEGGAAGGSIKEQEGGSSEPSGSGAGGSGSSLEPKGNAGTGDEGGLRIYLSAIREWKIEFGANMLFVWIRTDMFWYRLGKPSAQYKPFYAPVIKIAKLAIDIISMLKEEARVARLSFSDIVGNIAEKRRKDKEKPCTKQEVARMERFLVVHGQIILQQFREYPDNTIKRSAFASGLERKMSERHHTKLKISKKIVKRALRNNNPSANLRPDATKRKPMPATTTRLVKGVWSRFYEKMARETEIVEEIGESKGKEDEGEGDGEVEDVQEEDSDEETELAVLPKGKKGSKRVEESARTGKRKAVTAEVKWIGKPTGKMPDGSSLYDKVIIDKQEISVGSAVLVNMEGGGESEESALPILLVEYMWKGLDGSDMIHGRVLERGADTVLGNAANERELFLTEQCSDTPLQSIRSSISVEKRIRPWGHQFRRMDYETDETERARAKERQEKGLPMEFFFQKLYAPAKGAFLDLPEDLAAGNGHCPSCTAAEAARKAEETRILSGNQGFQHQGVTYHLHDFVYLESDAFEKAKDGQVAGEKFKGSRNVGLKPWAIGQLLKVDSKLEKGSKKTVPFRLAVRRFYRPDDISSDLAYQADLREVYFSQKTVTVDVGQVRGKCQVFRQVPGEVASEQDDTFFCGKSFDPKTDKLTSVLPNSVDFSTALHSQGEKAKDKGKGKAPESPSSAATAAAAARKGKGKMVEEESSAAAEVTVAEADTRLATLDIFAGCGGLSEGLHQSGVSRTKWAIEYEHPAAEAFAINHPEAEVFCDNCNVILRCLMEKGGDLEDCISTEEADRQATAVTEEKRSKLPIPGQVDFINGGPPCQGFSGMNRFNNRAWSKVQCEMILAFLSFADYLRPRYFLLENVRNFVSFNKGQTFRLTLASLLAMGYQVRFGVLQAGNYGVAQSRKRAFIWAAAPGELLPDWPKPRHVFASSQISITLPGGQQYSAVPNDGKGAPLRSITVKDTIGELPAVENGANKDQIEYADPPQSWFQKRIRGTGSVLWDHISKEMNELNLERCKRIPKEEPGADWRKLPPISIKLKDGRQVALIPWCLPNTADRHNQWKGLFGRLDWSGNFPTSVTDPQPMGKVGMCFHPTQDRIITVRECARSQGFPDRFRFYGSILAKHRQIGNAVPPPLARALGASLKAALEARRQSQERA